MVEHNGLMPRRGNEATLSDLDGTARADLRGAGIRFGEYYVFMPDLIKPAAANLLSLLVAFGEGGDSKPYIPFAGITSVKMEEGYSEAAFNAAGYSGRGSRILRVDILNRLGDLIRQAKKEAGGPRFKIAMEMMALLGTSYEGAQEVLVALGYKSQPAPKVESKNEDVKPVENTKVGSATPEAKSETTEATEVKPQAEEGAKTEAQAKPAAPNALGADGKPKHNMPAAPTASKKAKKKGPQPLNYYEPIISQDEQGNDVRGPQETVWLMPYKSRKPKRAYNGSKDQNAGDGSGTQDRRKPRGKSTGWGEKPKDGARRGKGKKPPRGNSGSDFKPKRDAMKPEDSPFAALAALKLGKKD